MRKLLVFILIAAAPALIAGQTRKKPVTKKPVPKPTPAVVATPVETPSLAEPEPTPDTSKKNSRPARSDVSPAKNYTPVYTYTFERPGFKWSRIRIEHDEDGRGRAWFERDGSDEMLDDPVQVSAATMEKLKAAFAELNFLDSTEDYQFSGRDYSNMGNLSITLTRGGRSRTVKYNWTENKGARSLMDTYRAIANEAIWKFEITSARDLQPLLTPGLVDTLDAYLRMKEIADPPHLVPFMTTLSNDERLPLIARNHLTKLIAQISKSTN